MLQKYWLHSAQVWENSKARQGHGNWISEFPYKGSSLAKFVIQKETSQLCTSLMASNISCNLLFWQQSIFSLYVSSPWFCVKSSEILFGKQCLVQGVIWVDPSDHLDIDTSRYFTNHAVSVLDFFLEDILAQIRF